MAQVDRYRPPVLPEMPKEFTEILFRHQAKYPNATLAAFNVRAYWEDLSKFPLSIIDHGLKEARRQSPSFFPPAPLVEQCCESLLAASAQRMAPGNLPALPAGEPHWGRQIDEVRSIVEGLRDRVVLKPGPSRPREQVRAEAEDLASNEVGT